MSKGLLESNVLGQSFSVTASSGEEDAKLALIGTNSMWQAEMSDIFDGRVTFTFELNSPGQLMDFQAKVYGVRVVKFKVKVAGYEGFHNLTSDMFTDQVCYYYLNSLVFIYSACFL